MSSSPEAQPRPRSTRRWAVWGFVLGLAITVPATWAAMLSLIGEAAHPYLVPSAYVLRPLTENMATWSGLTNVTIASVTNGLIYAAVASTVGALLGARRHH